MTSCSGACSRKSSSSGRGEDTLNVVLARESPCLVEAQRGSVRTKTGRRECETEGKRTGQHMGKTKDNQRVFRVESGCAVCVVHVRVIALRYASLRSTALCYAARWSVEGGGETKGHDCAHNLVPC